jgi:hypothetical protein
MTLQTLQRLAQHPNIQAIKDCGCNAGKTQQLIADGQLQVLAGEDHQIFGTVAAGGSGAGPAEKHVSRSRRPRIFRTKIEYVNKLQCNENSQPFVVHKWFTRDGGSGRGEADAGTQCPVSNRDPPNLFPNGDFECGSESFQSSGGNGRVDFVAGRTGKALRLTVAPGVFNNEFTSSWRFRLEQSGVYCARAFVRGSATTVVLRLYVGPPGAAMGEMFSMPGPRGLWSMLPPTVTAIQAAGMAGDEAFLVFADSSPSVGATIEVDDVDVHHART